MKQQITLTLLLALNFQFLFGQVLLQNCLSENDVSINKKCQSYDVELSASQSFVSIPQTDQNYNKMRIKWEFYRYNSKIKTEKTVPDQLFNGITVNQEGEYKVVVKHQILFIFFWITNTEHTSNTIKINSTPPYTNNNCIDYGGICANDNWTGAGVDFDKGGWHIGDFDGDGKDDIFRYEPGTSGADMFLSTGTSFNSVGSWTGAGVDFDKGGWHIGDFNGDGKDDIFRYVAGISGADMYLSNGNNF